MTIQLCYIIYDILTSIYKFNKKLNKFFNYFINSYKL